MTGHPGWPATLEAGPVRLRPPKLRDAKAWSEVRLRNQYWLERWEPTSPYSWAERHATGSWPQLHSALKRAGRAGTMLPFMLDYAERFVGQELVLSEPIVDGFGRVALGDSVWRISGPDLQAGARIRIVGADGAVLKVEAA